MTEHPNSSGIYHPTHIQEWHIYDCLYADSGELVIISAAEIVPAPRIWLILDLASKTEQEFRVDICPAKHTYVYRLSTPETKQIINIRIKKQTEKNTTEMTTDQIITIRPNKYPSYTNQVVMTTMVKHEDNIIRVWVDFHMRLGIHKFVIYDNAGTAESLAGLARELSDYINTGQVILISWPYDYRKQISGISGQTTQQNQAIRAFDTADWLGLFDVDEYINIQRPDIIFGAAGDSGIRRFLDGIARKTALGKSGLGGLQFSNKFFYNPDNLPTENGQFLRITNSAKEIIFHNRGKCFIKPKQVQIFGIHVIFIGKVLFRIPERLAYFNHYCYLNKSDRGRDSTPWRDNSITRYFSYLTF